MNLLLGCDPEIFLRDRNTGQFVSAHGLIDGDKKNPLRVNKGAIQIDGTAVEFNIDPAKNLTEFKQNINVVMKQLEEAVRARNPDVELAITPTAHYDPAYFAGIPEGSKELGCEPDYNAYTRDVNPRPDSDRPMRTASGHIHIGWTDGQDPLSPEHFEDCCAVTKQLDGVLLPASKAWDKDEDRRSMYGAKGAFRPKPYGCEYRVLSNKWLEDPKLITWVYKATNMAILCLKNGLSVETLGLQYLQTYYSIPKLPKGYSL
jgi:hypothetical protein